MPASQDYRDGVASGVSALVTALAKVEMYGIPITVDLARNVGAEIRAHIGGTASPFWPDEASQGADT